MEIVTDTVSFGNEKSECPHHRTPQKYRMIKGGFKDINDLFAVGFNKYPKNEFLVSDFGSIKRLTYDETNNIASAIGYELVNTYGVKAGDRVSILGRNSVEWAISFIAATSIGATAVPMNSWWTTEELEYGLNDSGTSVVFVDEERYNRCAKIPKGKLINPNVKYVCIQFPKDYKYGAHMESFESIVKRGLGKQAQRPKIAPEDNVMIMYTSGTTASPKGVVLTHRGLSSIMSMYAILTKIMPSSGQDAALLTVPLFHATGMHVIFLQSFIVGRKLVFMYKWDAGNALELIVSYILCFLLQFLKHRSIIIVHTLHHTQIIFLFYY